jgi:RHS repeat-associated protein
MNKLIGVRLSLALLGCVLSGAAISAVTITPPNLAGSVGGTIPGHASVSMRGAAQYAFDVPVPPGTVGVSPKLGLQYDSENRSDVSGVGWTLSGLSTISRCKRTFASDGFPQAIKLAAQDAYCLNGERLIKISGTEGATAEFRTEVESFSRIKSFGTNAAKGPDYWTVETRSERVLTLGGTTGNATVVAPGKTAVMVWLLARSQDAHGNYMSYRYQAPTGTGEHVLQQIRYTGNDAAGLVPYNAVNFGYDTRADTYRGYFFGALIQRSQRLKTIEAVVNTAADGTAGTVVRKWNVAYVYSTTSGRSLVQSVTDCDGGGSGACLPATTFQWTQRSASANTFSASGSGNWGGPAVTFGTATADGSKSAQVGRKAIAADFGGDGRVDLLYNNAGSTTWNLCSSTGTSFACSSLTGMPAIASEKFLVGDFDADGRADILIPPASGSTTGWWRCKSNGSSFTCATFSTNIASRGQNANNYMIGDLTGDGRADLLIVAQPTLTSYLCPSNGTAFGTCTAYGGVSLVLVGEVPGDSYVSRLARMTGDFNGDGILDVMTSQTSVSGINVQHPTYFDQTEFTLFAGGQTGFTTIGFARATGASSGGRSLGDLNGDGYQDFSYGAFAYDASNAFRRYATTCLTGGVGIYCNTIDATANPKLADAGDLGSFDGTDMATARAGGGILRFLSDGTPTGYTAWTVGPSRVGVTGCVAGDFNGDGLREYACYTESTQQWVVDLVGSGSFPDRLETVTDGQGLVTKFSYAAGWDPSVYTAGALPAYPAQNSVPTFPVVSKLSVSASSPADTTKTLDVSYRYAGWRANLNGRGSLGFETVISTEAVSGIATTTVVSQTFPTIGQRTSLKRISAGGVELARETPSWQNLQTYPGVLYPYVRQSTSTGRDLDGTILPTRISQVGTAASTTDGIDGFGSVLSQTVTVQDSSDVFATASTCSSIDNRTTTSWILGLCTSTTVTASAPAVASVTRETARTFDAWGVVTSETVQPNDPLLRLQTTYTLDAAYGVVNKVSQTWTDPVTAQAVSRDTATYGYDTRKRFATQTADALGTLNAGNFMARDYEDRSGLAIRETDPNGVVTTWEYDAWRRKTRESQADGTFTTWAYKTCVSGCGTATTVTVTQQWATPGGVAAEQSVVPSEEFFDPHKRSVLRRSWDYAGAETFSDSIYDLKGRLSDSSAVHTLAQRNAGIVGWAKTAYDDLGRKTSVKTTKADNSGFDLTTIAYSGLSTTTTDPKLHARTVVQNGQGKPKRVTDALNSAVTYLYDPFGNLLKTTDPLGNQTQVVYDKLGRRTQLLDPNLGNWTYVPDALGRVRSQTDAKLQVTTFEFDALDRMTRRLEPDLDSRWVFDTAPNGKRRLAEAYTWVAGTSSKDYRRTHAYDTVGRETQTVVTLDWDYSTLTAYNGYGQPSQLTHRRNAIGATDATAQVELTLGYNNQGGLSTLQRSGVVVWALECADAANRPTRESLGATLKSQHQYNDFTGRLDAIRTGTASGGCEVTATLQGDSYAYDAVGNVMTRSQWGDNVGGLMTETFAYDVLDRVRSSQVAGQSAQTFAIDAIGNITSRTSVGSYVYPAAGTARPHLLSSITGTVAGLTNPGFSYDANGNIANGLNRAYEWSTANLPFNIDRLSDGTLTSANLRYAFLYGPERQRTLQTIRLMSGIALGAEQRRIYSGGGIEKEIDFAAANTKIRTYLPQGLGYVEESFAGTALAPTATATRVERYFLKDSLGSLNVVVDAAGTVLQRMGYDAWGRRRNANGSEMAWSTLGPGGLANLQDHTGYTGQLQLDDLGLVHLNGRVYDPMLGRMTSPDPTVPEPYDLQSWNRASYVQNNPMGFADPTGFSAVDVQNTPQVIKAADAERELRLDRFKAAQGWVTVVDNRGASNGSSSASSDPTPSKSTSGTESNAPAAAWAQGAAEARFGQPAPSGFGEAAKDAGVGLYNGAVNTAEVLLNLFPGATVPGAADYVRFDAIKIDRKYSDPAIGHTSELAGGGIGVLSGLAKIRGVAGGIGEYGLVSGHHVHAKRAFEGVAGYDRMKALAVSDGALARFGVRHADVTAAQQRLFRALDASGAPNNLTQHSRVAYQALVQAGVPANAAKQMVIQSQSQLIRFGAVEPARIPWGTR